MHMPIADSLKEFGLNEKEARVYLALLELGEAKAHEIARKAGVVRPTAYDILEKLITDGLVGAYDKKKIRHYTANEPEKIRQKLLEKQRMFETVLPELKSVYNKLKAKPKISFFEGIEGTKTVFNDTLTAADKQLRGILSMYDLFKIPGKSFMDSYVKRRVGEGFSLRVIRSQPKEVMETWPTSTEENRQLRYAPPHMIFEMTTYIYANKVSLISTAKENFGMIIESEEFARTMGYMFEALWQVSQPA